MAGQAKEIDKEEWRTERPGSLKAGHTLFTALLDAAATHGRKTLILEDMQQTADSYGNVIKKSLALGRMAAKISAEREVVGILLPNVAITLCLLFGMTAMRRIPAMLNFTSGATGMQHACVAANIKTILSSRKFIESAKLGNDISQLRQVRILYLEDLRQEFNLWDKAWLMGYAQWLPRLATKHVYPEEIAAILFTSGSEGRPKGVAHSHSSLLANIAQVQAIIDFSPADKFMIALPLFHAFGFTCGGIMPLVTGSKLMLYPSPLHYQTIPEVIQKRGCTVLFGTSTFLGNYARFARPNQFSRLRCVVAGAEKLSEEVRKTWADKFGIPILEGYGATECGPVLAVNTPEANSAGSVGRLLPGVEARLENIPGIEEGSLLHVRGPNLMQGYLLTEYPGALQPLAGGWYNTGDIVLIDEDGFVHIRGRVKRFAKIAGEMISLGSVEALAALASPSHAHAATTQAGSERGENIVLFTTDPALRREQLLETARRQGTPEIAVPRKLQRVEELPVLSTGKVDYLALKEMARLL